MPALFIAAFAYDSAGQLAPHGSGRPRLHQSVLTAWSQDALRDAIGTYLRERVPAAVESALIGAFDGNTILDYVERHHILTALALYESAFAAQESMRLGVSLTIHPMTAHRASQPIHVASAYSHGAPSVVVALSAPGLDGLLERVSQSARHIERFTVEPLPAVEDTPPANELPG